MNKHSDLIAKICLNSDVIYSGDRLHVSTQRYYYRVTNTKGHLVNTYANSKKQAIKNAIKLGLHDPKSAILMEQ